VTVNEGKVHVSLASTAMNEQAQDSIESRVAEAVKKVSGVTGVSVEYTEVPAKELNKIKNVIAVMSGKGGVGKSLVSSLVAMALRRQGKSVGILDADITGPSIPRIFGINDRASGNESGIMPIASKTGIEVMSINLLLNNEDEAVIWRGPLIAQALNQFWDEVLWGNLDYMIVDLPPGTADAPLTILQTLPISGIIIVFTPQTLTAMVVRKAVKMAQSMSKPIIGVIENMSYLYVPEIKRKLTIFGKSRAEEMAMAAGAPLLGQLPIDPELARLCDEGKLENYNSEDYTAFVENLAKVLKNGN